MRDRSSKNPALTLVALCFCIFVLLMAGMNCKLAARPALSWIMGELSFKEMTQEIAENYVSSRLWLRSSFINFNGLFARVSERHAYNQTMLMDNGMLNYGTETFSELPDETLEIKLSESIGEFSDYLGTMEIPFYFVLVPVKEDLGGELLPEAFHNYQNQTGSHLLDLLSDKGVDTLDLRQNLAQTAEQSEQYFYRTDHHWNGDGALEGFGIMMDYLRQSYDPQMDTSFTAKDLWQRFTLENSFLGTHGKRVGRLYAGTDDLIWYEPIFDTDLSLSIPDFSEFYRGPFSEVNIREQYRERQDYFAVTPYVIYVGGDYPIVRHRNVDAPNQKKVLFLKDSFGLAIQAFLSTEFSAVDVIDPRYFTDAGIAEYCEWERPDLVIMMMSPSAVSNRYYNRVGISEEERERIENREEHILWTTARLKADGQNQKEKLTALPVIPENGKTYRVSFKEVSPLAQMPETISVILYNRTIEAIAQQRIFDPMYDGKTKSWQWTFTVPAGADDEEFALYLCSGLFGAEQGDEITIEDISITELT